MAENIQSQNPLSAYFRAPKLYTTIPSGGRFYDAEIMTVPGAKTSPSEYFCFMERESFPVGILIPKEIAKSEHS